MSYTATAARNCRQLLEKSAGRSVNNWRTNHPSPFFQQVRWLQKPDPYPWKRWDEEAYEYKKPKMKPRPKVKKLSKPKKPKAR